MGDSIDPFLYETTSLVNFGIFRVLTTQNLLSIDLPALRVSHVVSNRARRHVFRRSSDGLPFFLLCVPLFPTLHRDVGPGNGDQGMLNFSGITRATHDPHDTC